MRQLGDVRQQAHDDEFAGADPEAADGHRQLGPRTPLVGEIVRERVLEAIINPRSNPDVQSRPAPRRRAAEDAPGVAAVDGPVNRTALAWGVALRTRPSPSRNVTTSTCILSHSWTARPWASKKPRTRAGLSQPITSSRTGTRTLSALSLSDGPPGDRRDVPCSPRRRW